MTREQQALVSHEYAGPGSQAGPGKGEPPPSLAARAQKLSPSTPAWTNDRELRKVILKMKGDLDQTDLDGEEFENKLFRDRQSARAGDPEATSPTMIWKAFKYIFGNTGPPPHHHPTQIP